MNELMPWSTTAINLPDHADNKIHTDEGARAAGFDAALVAGTTIYAYMTRPAVQAWGRAWLSGGGGELRLRRPVFDNDAVVEAGLRAGVFMVTDEAPTIAGVLDPLVHNAASYAGLPAQGNASGAAMPQECIDILANPLLFISSASRECPQSGVQMSDCDFYRNVAWRSTFS